MTLNQDLTLKQFWRDNDRFADLFNAVLFHGESIIHPKDLSEMDTDVSTQISTKEGTKTIRRYRDVIKKSSMGADFAILGLENQSAIHYGMPLRTMVYDALNYQKEYDAVTQKNKREKRSSPEEFLSGFKKSDRLHPVFSIILYYNDAAWSGPKSLKDMMVPMPPQLSECFFDYPMRLVQIPDTAGYHFLHPDVDAVFDILRLIYEKDYSKLREKYEHKMIRQAVLDAVGSITAAPLKNIFNERKEEVNMWASLKEWQQEGYLSGVAHSQQSIITQMLANHLEIDFIHQVTNIPMEEIKKVQKQFLNTPGH